MIASIPQAGLEAVRNISPVQAWKECVNLTVLDQQEVLAIDRATVERIEHARELSIKHATPSVAILLALGALSVVLGIGARRKAIARRSDANGRWPVPRMPVRDDQRSVSADALTSESLPSSSE